MYLVTGQRPKGEAGESNSLLTCGTHRQATGARDPAAAALNRSPSRRKDGLATNRCVSWPGDHFRRVTGKGRVR